MIYRYVAFDVTEGRDVAWSDVSLEEVTYEERIRFNSEVELLRSVTCDYIIRHSIYAFRDDLRVFELLC